MDIKRTAKVLTAAAATAYFSKKAIDFRNNQFKTIKSVSKLNNSIYLCDYSFDYKLDAILKKGIKNTAQLLAYVSDTALFGARLLKFGSGKFACSSFNAKNENGEPLFGRNFDYKKAPCMVVWTHPQNGYKSAAVADCNFMLYGDVNKPVCTFNRLQTLLAPYCCMDGINEKGLAIGVLELKSKPTSQSTGKTDIATTVVIRAVPDKCATVDEATEFLASYDMHDAFFCCYHYQLTDAHGKSVIIEYVNNEMRLIYPEDGKNFQFAANFFISNDGDNAKGFGYDRAELMAKRLTETDGRLSTSQAVELLKSVSLNYRHEKYPWQVTTLWSAVYNSSALTATIAAGLDYDNTYTFGVDTPCEIKKDS